MFRKVTRTSLSSQQGSFLYELGLQITCMRNEAGPNQLAHHYGQVGGDRHHSVLQVVVQLCAIIGNLDHLRKRWTVSELVEDK